MKGCKDMEIRKDIKKQCEDRKNQCGDEKGQSKEYKGYQEKFEKYLCGELKESESQRIEEDIEKFQVLLSHMDQTLDMELYEKEDEGLRKEGEEQEKEAELGRRISKAVARKFRHYMIAAVAAAICIVPALLAGISPLLDRICYNPDQSVEIADEENDAVIVVNPFVTDMSVYMEMFCGDKGFVELRLWAEGYGRYTIDVCTQIDGENTSHMLELVRNHLYRNDFTWNRSDFPDNAFIYGNEGKSCSMEKEAAGKKLEEAPEMMKIRAAVSFDGLKSMEELVDFMRRYDTQYLYCPIETGGGRYWGFSPVKAGYDLDMTYDQEEYPYLDLSQFLTGEEKFASAEIYEQHMESMVRYLMERKDFLKIFDGGAPGGKNFLNTYEYERTLDYIREQGVKSYGTVVYATKQELLKILEDPSVNGIYMLEGKLDLKF